MSRALKRQFGRRLVFALLILGGSSIANADARVAQTIGQAYDLESNELLYSETHCVNSDRDAREVIYQNRDGRLIARKLLDYGSGRITPSFVQHNLYSSETIAVELSDGELTMSVLEAGNPEAIKISSAQPGEKLPVVIDAGFDEFVREHWDELVEGGSKKFLFPFAARSRLVELRIRPVACSYGSETDQCFKLDLSNWFLRLLAEPIELGYDEKARRLSRYRGLSNIGDENGDGLVVDIRYDYRDIPARACRVNGQTPGEDLNLREFSRLYSAEAT